MVTRDKDDPRNKEEGERGPGGVRIVVMDDLTDHYARAGFRHQMRVPGSPMFEKLSKMKVGKGRGGQGGSSGTLGHHSS
jgi:hypothetical protein